MKNNLPHRLSTFTFYKVSVISFFFILQAFFLYAQPTLVFTAIDSGYSNPLDVKHPGNDPNKLFIVEQTGKIYVKYLNNNTKKLFLDLTNKIKFNGGEKGLLGIAFDPKYNKNRRFYVYYNDINTSNVTIARYLVSKQNSDSAIAGSGVTLISEPKPGGYGIHNGGCLQFSSDKYLYIGIGDGSANGDPLNVSQNGNSLYGKLLRIDVNVRNAPYYQIPPDNPFINDPNVKDEIWALGLRNPWRFSFDRQTNDLWIGDVGQNDKEEVDYAKPNESAGRNYGWRCYEGTLANILTGCGNMSNYTFPIFEYNHDLTPDGTSVTGGYVYRGNDYPAMKGYYLCADYIAGAVFLIKPDGSGGWTSSMQSNTPPFTSFGEDDDGELYGVAFDGKLYRISTAANFSKNTVKSQAEKTLVYPTVVTGNSITIEMKEEFSFVRLTDLSGHEITRQKLPSAKMNTLKLTIPNVSSGMYILQLAGKITEQHKIFIQH